MSKLWFDGGMAQSPLSAAEVEAVLRQAKLKAVGQYLGAGKPIQCECLVCGASVSPRIATLKRGHSGCKFCSAQLRAGHRRIPESQARKQMIDAGVEPLEPYEKIGARWKSKCLVCGEVVSPALGNVRQGHAACKFCARKAITLERATSIYLEAGGIPTSKFRGTNEPWQGTCLQCGGSIAPRLADLQRGQGCCRLCGYEQSKATQRLTAEEAERRMVTAGAQPLEPWDGKGVDDPWLAECLTCGTIVAPSIHSISAGQGPCKACGRLSASQKNRIRPEVAYDICVERGFEPLEQFPGTKTAWLTRCLNCGEQAKRWFPNIQNGVSCRTCALEAKKVPQDIAVARLDKIGFRALEPFPGTGEPWYCECLNCGGKGYKRLGNQEKRFEYGETGCRDCSVRDLGTQVYLTHHRTYRSFKIGVGKKRRIDEHLTKGWTLVRIWNLESASEAYQLEGLVLDYVRNIWGRPQYLGRDEMPQGGHTETFADDELEAEEVVYLVGKLLAKPPLSRA